MKKIIASVSALLIGFALFFLYHDNSPKTPLEVNQYQSLPKSAQISDFLHGLANDSTLAKIVTLGQSAGGRDIEAILISQDPEFLKTGQANPHKLSVMIIGSQHATEESGAEALQMVTRDVLTDTTHHWLSDMNLILIVNANPDGRDNNSRFNETGGNINIDYIALNEDETTIFVNALKKYQPNIILDLHESSINKAILTKEQGYVHHYESQFGVNNNPNIAASLNQFSEQIFLPTLIQNNINMGLPAQKYRGEILQLNQSVAQAGHRLWNFRNYSGMNGAISVLVENRLDMRDGEYPTPGNIKARAEKQKISIEAFLNTAQTYKNDILKVTHAARSNWSSDLHGFQKILTLRHRFVQDTQNPTADIPLLNLTTGEPETHAFPNLATIDATIELTLPKAYVITHEQARFEKLLNRHHLSYEVIKEPKTVMVTQSVIEDITITPNHLGTSEIVLVEIDEKTAEIELKPGDLWISVNQPMGQLIPLLLDPRASDSVFQEKTYRSLLKQDEVLFIYRID